MKALGSETRVKILKMLQQKSLCVCEIKEALGGSQPNISQHLKILEDSGLVTAERDGQWINYRLRDGSENKYARTILDHLQEWLEDEKEVKDLMRTAKRVDRSQILKK